MDAEHFWSNFQTEHRKRCLRHSSAEKMSFHYIYDDLIFSRYGCETEGSLIIANYEDRELIPKVFLFFTS